MSAKKDKGSVLNSAKLVWQDESSNIQEFILNENVTAFLGREDNNDIVFPSREVSKQHATLYWMEDGFVIVDQGSSNGTIVNGVQITEPTTLQDGDRIEIGGQVLSYYFLGERLFEEYKTMPLSDALIEEAATVAVEEPKETEKLIEQLETMVVPDLEVETEEQVGEEASEDIQEIPTEAIEEVEAEELEKPAGPPKEFMDMDAAFADLIAQVQAAQDTAKALKDQARKAMNNLDAFAEKAGGLSKDLEAVASENLEFETKTSEAKFLELLDQLIENPNNVTLLVTLAQHAELIKNMVKNLSAHGKVLSKIKEELETELANLLG